MTTVFNRRVEVRCSTQGCPHKTHAWATPVVNGRWETNGPVEDGWVQSQTGRETGAALDWYYATCPDHAKA